MFRRTTLTLALAAFLAGPALAQQDADKPSPSRPQRTQSHGQEKGTAPVAAPKPQPQPAQSVESATKKQPRHDHMRDAK
jgi:hypothetical protein